MLYAVVEHLKSRISRPGTTEARTTTNAWIDISGRGIRVNKEHDRRE